MSIYNINYFCVYNDLMDDNVFEDGESKEEMEEIRLYAYRRDLSGIFQKNMQNFDFIEELTQDVLTIFYHCQSNFFFQQCISLIKSKTIINDDVSVFLLLFSYDYLFLTHNCLSAFFEKGDIPKELQDLLLEKISQLS